MYNLIKESYFVIVGLTGVGKSTFVNAISNKKCCRVSVKGKSMTQNHQLIRFSQNHHTFYVVDTPGLGDSQNNERVINELKTLLSKWPFLKKIVIIKPYTEIRLADYLQKALEVIMDCFPLQNFWDHVLIVNNRCIPTDEAYKDFLEENPETFLDKLKQCTNLLDFMKSKNIDCPNEVKEFFIDSKKKDKFPSIKQGFDDIIENIQNTPMMFKTIRELKHVRDYKDGISKEIRIIFEYDPIECTDFKGNVKIIKKNYKEKTEVKEEYKQKIVKLRDTPKEKYLGSIDAEWYDILSFGISWALRPTERYRVWDESEFKNIQTGQTFVEETNVREELR
jgi:hypothetical protein